MALPRTALPDEVDDQEPVLVDLELYQLGRRPAQFAVATRTAVLLPDLLCRLLRTTDGKIIVIIDELVRCARGQSCDCD